MSFRLMPKTTISHARGDVVRMYSRHDNRDGTLCVRFQIGTKALDAACLKIGDRVTFSLGQGDDQGRLRLTKSEQPDAYTILKAGTGAYCGAVRRRGVEGWINEPNPATTCAWRVARERGVLEIALPDWAGGPPVYQDQKIAHLKPKARCDERGKAVKGLSE